MTPAGPAAFAGAVLCGGASRRMGRDKALIEIDGRPLAARVADALRRAGADPVVAVGGDLPALARWGLAGVPDDRPGEGPLAGIVRALDDDGPGVVLVAACDLLHPAAEAFAACVTALEGADTPAGVAVPTAGGRRQWASAAWRRSVRPALLAQLDRGERAVHRAVAAAGVRVVEVPGVEPAALADADTPDALPPG